MSGKIAIDKLKPHPKNDYYFSDVTGEKYDEIKRSIETYGIRDPLKVTTAYTIVSGHQRYRIAKELGFTEVPVEIVDVDEWQAEYLLIAENVERRGQAEIDPIKKARIAQFLKEYWGVQHGNNQYNRKDQNGLSKIADTLDESLTNTKRLLKLNDLIPEIQALVSAGQLGTTAAEQLAYLTEDEQRVLFGDRGQGLSEISVADAKALRQEIEQLRKENEELRAKADKPPIEKPVVKEVAREVVPEDVQRRIREAEERARQAERERAQIDEALAQAYARVRELEQLERSIKNDAENPLYDAYRSVAGTVGYLKVITDNERFSRDIIANTDRRLIDKLSAEVALAMNLLEHVQEMIRDETVREVIDITEYRASN